MKKLFYILLSAVASLAVLSCEKEVAHEPGEPDVEGCYGVYFPSAQEAAGAHTFDPSQAPEITFTVARLSDKDEITVPVVVTASEENVFEVGTLKFAAGQKETTLLVKFPNAKEGIEYTLNLGVTDEKYASKYSDKSAFIDFSLLRVQWQDLQNPLTGESATVTFTEGWWGIVVEAKVKFYEVDGVRTCETYDEKVIESGNEDAGETGFWGAGENNHLSFIWFTNKVDEKDHQMIDVPKQYFGYDYADWKAKPIGEAGNPIFAYDWFHYLTTDGGYPGGWPDWEGFLERNPGVYDRSYYDGNGGFYLNLRYYIPGLGGWTPDTFDTVGIVPGYTRVDYSLDAEADYGMEGVVPVYLTAGADIASVKYAVYEGVLNAVQVAAKAEEIEADDKALTFSEFEEGEDGKKYGTLGIECPATGQYTIVILGYDADGEMQIYLSTDFPYVSADDEADYAVQVNVFTEDTPARYTELHPYDSFAYGIYGSGLLDVHMGIFDASKALASQAAFAAYAEAVKIDEDGDFAVSAEILEQINAAGGYYTVESPVNAKTSYVVLVWATNGNLDTFAYSVYTTEPMPYVWNSIGVGLYTEDVACGLYGIDPVTVECNVYQEEANPGLYMIDGFQKNFIEAMLDPEEDGPVEDYENVLWHNAELVIDASDPANVIIELQDYGICLNPSDGFIDGLTSVYQGKPFSVGTLENGVISFPTAKGMLCLLNGDGYYYANQHGAFKLELPAANNAAPVAPKAGLKAARKAETVSPYTRARKYERDAQAVEVKVTLLPVGKKSFTMDSPKPFEMANLNR